MTVASRAALVPAASLRGGLELPSDKSISHRALICAALAKGDSRITLRQPGADVLSTLDALARLGVKTDSTTAGEETVAWVRGLGDGKSLGRLGEGMAD